MKLVPRWSDEAKSKYLLKNPAKTYQKSQQVGTYQESMQILAENLRASWRLKLLPVGAQMVGLSQEQALHCPSLHIIQFAA